MTANSPDLTTVPAGRANKPLDAQPRSKRLPRTCRDSASPAHDSLEVAAAGVQHKGSGGVSTLREHVT